MNLRINTIIMTIIVSMLCLRSVRSFRSHPITQYHRISLKHLSTKKITSPLFSFTGEIVDQRENLDRNSYLFGEKSVKFKDLGLGDELVKALSRQGFEDATMIQSKAIPVALSGSDIVIGAETGSGKTLSFLLPVLDRLIRSTSPTPTKIDQTQDVLQVDEEIDGLLEDVAIDDSSYSSQKDIKYPIAVILMPNKELCAQVMKVATTLMQDINTNATIGFAPALDSYDPFPDLVISTPSFLTRFLRGSTVLNPEVFRSIKQVVLDEADMLLEGSYLTQIEDILSAFKVVRRRMIRDGDVLMNQNTVQHILSAATIPSYGLRSIENYIDKRYPHAKKVSQEYLHEHHPRITQNFIRVKTESVCSNDRIDMLISAIQDLVIPSSSSSPVPLSTMASPSSITADSGDNAWLHVPSTMVFVNTAQAAKDLTFFLQRKNLPCVDFHKLVPEPQKSLNLKRFRDGEMKVIICTDSAARGLDLPSVKHVIQAEFAQNVVQHLHRIGRASRAGVAGYATNFYDDSVLQLVKTILPSKSSIIKDHDADNIQLHDVKVADEKEDRSVQQAFSRRRGLRRKHKRHEQNLSKAADDHVDVSHHDDAPQHVEVSRVKRRSNTDIFDKI